eukprot:COSAG02_NODE_2261_length_9322_cov_152.037298_5_plen_51_part_00
MQEALLREELKVLHADNQTLRMKYDDIVARLEKTEQTADQFEQVRPQHAP